MKNTIIGICILLSLLCIISDAARAATTTEVVPGYSQAPIEGNSGLSVSLYKRAWISSNNGSYKLTSQAYSGCNADPPKRNTTQSVVAYASASADRSTWPIVSKSYIEPNLSASNLADGHVRATRTRDPSAPSGKKWYYHFAKKTSGKSQVVYKAHTILWHITGFLGPITPRWLGGKNTKRTFRLLTETMQAEWTASSRSGLDTSVVPYAYGQITSYSSNTNGGTGIMIASVEADTTKNPDGTDNQYDSLSTSFAQTETVGTGTPIIVCPACEEAVIYERQHLSTCKRSHLYQRFDGRVIYQGMAILQGCGETYWSCVGEGYSAHQRKRCQKDNCGLLEIACGPDHVCEGMSDQEKYGGGNNGGNNGSNNGGTTSPAVGNGGGGTGGTSADRVRCGHGRNGNACSRGGWASSREAHKTTCPAGHRYYACSESGARFHANCRAQRSGEVRCARGSWCRSGGWASSRNAHQTTCRQGHTYWSCWPSAVSRHRRH